MKKAGSKGRILRRLKQTVKQPDREVGASIGSSWSLLLSKYY